MSDPSLLSPGQSRPSSARLQPVEVLLLLVCLGFLFAFSRLEVAPRYPAPPDFGQMTVEEKKRQFFAYLSPIITELNFQLAADRDRVRALRTARQRGDRLSWSDRRWLGRLAIELEVPLEEIGLDEGLEIMERRAGIVPESIVLVQAAVESGWGTSRFAREANNFFGQRCYRPNCGITPLERPAGSRFGLAEFASVEESIESYIMNLNTHESYGEFREMRLRRRNSGEPITGLSLVRGLENYSERGDDYVEDIASMIRANGLE